MLGVDASGAGDTDQVKRRGGEVRRSAVFPAAASGVKPSIAWLALLVLTP